MGTKVDTGFRFVAHQMHPITAMMEVVKSGIEQLQRRRYLAAYASILVSMLDRTQLAREAGHSRGMVMAMPGPAGAGIDSQAAGPRPRCRPTRPGRGHWCGS
ncbi:hypothetical protein [Paraburkholderia hospita]|uniref:hypothetical protein n=1 Tax=Paraburkholderia hospita TaxID=169430 RepID=UPI001404620B|nr:hypothetical protein [Paraburkholderia hospita]